MSDSKTTLTNAVHDLLRRAIIEQALKPGMRLPEDTVGEQFGVSRTIVRHALVRLENQGLVITRRNRGAFVASHRRKKPSTCSRSAAALRTR